MPSFISFNLLLHAQGCNQLRDEHELNPYLHSCRVAILWGKSTPPHHDPLHSHRVGSQACRILPCADFVVLCSIPDFVVLCPIADVVVLCFIPDFVVLCPIAARLIWSSVMCAPMGHTLGNGLCQIRQLLVLQVRPEQKAGRGLGCELG